jgi:uncharacterized RDD family membrane protein YckC
VSEVRAGWYPDPSQRAGVPMERYWDGFTWSRHVRPSGSVPSVATGPVPTIPYDAPGSIPTTPDGQALASWWSRVAAAALDLLVQLPLLVLAALPSLVVHWDSVADWWNGSVDGRQRLVTEKSVPNPPVLDPSTTPGLVLAASLFAVSIAYAIVFLRWKQATPGKLRLGLLVRRRSTPGPLPWGTILRRVGFVAVLAAVVNVPIIGFAFLVVAVLDYLWPLWDEDNQALHDKVAGTNVVLVSGRVR